MNYVFGCNAQFSETELDKMYQDAFGYKTDGVFVEVGAYTGVDISHTRALALLGWRGVLVEPIHQFAEECRKNNKDHPNITVIECAAGAHNGNQVMYWDNRQHDLIGATLNLAAVSDDHKQLGVQVRTLDDILESERILPGFDLLSIDVEFGEEQVLDGLTLDRWLPKMVIIELHEMEPGPKSALSKPAADRCNSLFWQCHYRKVYADKINSIFVRA